MLEKPKKQIIRIITRLINFKIITKSSAKTSEKTLETYKITVELKNREHPLYHLDSM